MTKLNLGCGSAPLEDYINIDMDSLEDLKARYPNKTFPECRIEDWDIFNLPIPDGSVDEVRADCLFEHLTFKEEKMAFYEVKRVLKPGGIFNLAVPDLEHIIKAWLVAEDNWQDWYRDDAEAISQSHWFGTYEYSYKNRWGYAMAVLYGSQNGEGQHHKNGYTISKLKSIAKHMNFDVVSSEVYPWHNDNGVSQIIRFISKKQ